MSEFFVQVKSLNDTLNSLLQELEQMKKRIIASQEITFTILEQFGGNLVTEEQNILENSEQL